MFAFLEWRATEDLLAVPSGDEVCLHAAGVTVGDRRLLLIGDPGSGKSTLAAHLTAMGGRGWGDDVVRFAIADSSFSAFPRSWKLDDKTLKDIDLLVALTSTPSDGMLLASDVWYISPAAIRADWADAPGRPDAVLLLDRDAHGRDASVERMSEGEAAIRVSTALLSAGAGHGPAWRTFMVKVLDGLRAVSAWRANGGPPSALARAVAGAVGA